MQEHPPTGKPFKSGQTIYAFEVGEGVFLNESGYDRDRGDTQIFFLDRENRPQNQWSYWCFAKSSGGWFSREWKLHKARILLKYHPADEVIQITLRSKDVKIQYSDDPNDSEYFETGDLLHCDWEGMGIDLPMLVEKWLKRINGNHIPLSDYFNDPFNRWLDGLGRPD